MTVEQRLRNLHLEASRWFSWKQGGDFPGGSVVKNLPANAGDTGSIPGPGDYHVLQSIQARVPQLWASALLPRNPSSWSLCPGTREATKMRSLCTTVNNNSHSPKLERSLNSSEDPPQPKKREREKSMSSESYHEAWYRKGVSWDPVGGKLLESKQCPQGGWGKGRNGVGYIWRNVFSLTKVSKGEANICYFREGVNFLWFLFWRDLWSEHFLHIYARF